MPWDCKAVPITDVNSSVMLMGNGAPHFDWATFNFFAAQALGLYLEQAVSKTTGKRVEGLLGRLWTYAFIIATSGDACESRLLKEDCDV